MVIEAPFKMLALAKALLVGAVSGGIPGNGGNGGKMIVPWPSAESARNRDAINPVRRARCIAPELLAGISSLDKEVYWPGRDVLN